MRAIPHSSLTGVGSVVDARCTREAPHDRARCERHIHHTGAHVAHHWFSQLPLYWPNEEKKS